MVKFTASKDQIVCRPRGVTKGVTERVTEQERSIDIKMERGRMKYKPA